MCPDVAGAVVAPFRIETIEFGDLGAGFAQRGGLATQISECSVARDELQILVEHRETKVQCIETCAKQGRGLIGHAWFRRSAIGNLFCHGQPPFVSKE